MPLPTWTAVAPLVGLEPPADEEELPLPPDDPEPLEEDEDEEELEDGVLAAVGVPAGVPAAGEPTAGLPAAGVPAGAAAAEEEAGKASEEELPPMPAGTVTRVGWLVATLKFGVGWLVTTLVLTLVLAAGMPIERRSVSTLLAEI